MLPEAPATLSTTTGWPILGDNRSATKRAMMSGPVPGVNGTTIFIGWSGHANACGAANRPPRSGIRVRRFIGRAFNQSGLCSSIQLSEALLDSSFFDAYLYLTYPELLVGLRQRSYLPYQARLVWPRQRAAWRTYRRKTS